jgi:hypothetical protein
VIGCVHACIRVVECVCVCVCVRGGGVFVWVFVFGSPSLCQIPDGLAWPALDRALRARGVTVGGSYGPHAGKLFRVGHMGEQAQLATLEPALIEIIEAIGELRRALPTLV